ncbi:MAG: hypothetical protein ACI8VC_002883 [Candidatus Endobugula sp.]|jgi:hypothetical protein
MTAFSSLILLIAIAALAMSVVAYSNHLVEKAKQTVFKLEKMKVRVEELEDVVLVLDSLCESRIIPKIVNEEIVSNYEAMIEIDAKAIYLKAGLSNAEVRARELSDDSMPRYLSRVCKSDAQMARYQTYLSESLKILRRYHMAGNISNQDMQSLILEINWLKLQVKVISNIAQGHKAYAKKGVLAAHGFYKKAQRELVRSTHPDPRRTEMISQMADLLFGRRKSLDVHLMPETDFNPDEVEIDVAIEEYNIEQQAILNAKIADAGMSQEPI